MSQIERAVVLMVAFTIAVSVLAATLPRLLPLVVVVYVLTLTGRLVWWYTR